MKIYPAIDIQNGKVVRLFKGRFEESSVYNEEPIEVAKHWQDLGADFIHVVDLDGARTGKAQLFELIKEMKAKTDLAIQVGGGLRNPEIIERYFAIGVDRVVVGSYAIREWESFQKLVRTRSPQKFTVAIDVKILSGTPYIFINGWQENSKTCLWDFMDKFSDCDGLRFLCTDIEKDGAMQGVNRKLYQSIRDRYPNTFIQCSGGISCLEDVIQIKKDGLESCVIGKALYEGRIELGDCLNTMRSSNAI